VAAGPEALDLSTQHFGEPSGDERAVSHGPAHGQVIVPEVGRSRKRLGIRALAWCSSA
jgi:hypothetical protein